MPALQPRILIAADEVSELLVFRRLLRDTPYRIDIVRSANQGMSAVASREYAAVIAIEELPDLPGARLLAEAERNRPGGLRILLTRDARRTSLVAGARAGRYKLFARHMFARPMLALLLDHAVQGQPKRERAADPERERTPDPDLRTTALPLVSVAEADTNPHNLPVSEGRAHRRMLMTMAELAEAKSGYAPGHGLRVSLLAGALARAAGLTAEELGSVEDAGLIHDVGELALDPAVLRRRRRLTPQERRGLKRHIESGYQIVHRSGLPNAVLMAVKHHHERWDGKGYPLGIDSGAIPLGARIVAVADTWDALATPRPYRDVGSVTACIKTIEMLGGSQLDPDLLAIFLGRKIYGAIDWHDPPSGGANLLDPPAP
jgi:HD-GYP domain-containing protein (c-di-GMP phosphodiesterase class II)